MLPKLSEWTRDQGDEHHMLFDCEVFAHLRTEPFAPCDYWNGEAWCDWSIRDFSSTAELYRCVPIMMDYVDLEQAARVEHSHPL